MRNIVSSLKKSVNNISKFEQLRKKLIPTTILTKCGFEKKKGISCSKILTELLLLSFEKKSLYQKAEKEKKMSGNIKTYYRFLETAKYQWEKLLSEVSEKAVMEFSKLTPRERHVLVIDDSLYERPNGKKVEMCSYQYDHVYSKMKRGFRFLAMGWSDGYSFIPMAFRLVSSNHTRLESDKFDKRTTEYRRRVNAVKKMSDSMIDLLQKVKSLGTQYVTCDSWFGTPKAIQQVHDMGFDVISIIRTNYLFFFRNGLYKAIDVLKQLDQSNEWCDLSKAQNINPNVRVVGSIVVRFRKEKAPVRLLFCTMKNSKVPEEITLLACTDLSLSAVEILELYAKRWSIETFFKTCKEHLGFCNDTFSLSLDCLIASKTICLLRYILITVNQRYENDPKTFSEMFYLYCDAIKDLCAIYVAWELLLAFYSDAKNRISSSVEVFIDLFDAFLKSIYPLDTLWLLP